MLVIYNIGYVLDITYIHGCVIALFIYNIDMFHAMLINVNQRAWSFIKLNSLNRSKELVAISNMCHWSKGQIITKILFTFRYYFLTLSLSYSE